MENKIKDLPAIGKQSQIVNFTDRTSMFFDNTAKIRNEDNQLIYAKNRNSKGILIPVMYTLTYPTNKEWEQSDISNFCKKINQYSQRNWGIKLRLIWVAETTKKGILHYHIVTWIPRNKRLPKASESLYYNNRKYPPLWKYRAEISGIRKSVFGYLTKYMSKGVLLGLGVSKIVNNGYSYEKQKNFNNYKEIDNFKSLHICCINKYKVGRLKLKKYHASTLLFRISETHCNKFYGDKKLEEIPDYDYVEATQKTRKVFPRIFGISGLDKEERQRISYYRLPYYVRRNFGDLRVGNTISRVKGGFKMNNHVRHFESFFVGMKRYILYADHFLPCNFSKVTYEMNGYDYLAYDFGANWSELPIPEYKAEVFFPF